MLAVVNSWLLLPATILPVVAIALWIREWLVAKKWKRTLGRVEGYVKCKGDDAWFFHPQLVFRTESGDMVHTRSNMGFGRRPWGVGQNVTVRYNPATPNEAEVHCFTNSHGLPLTFLALGVVGACMYWLLET